MFTIYIPKKCYIFSQFKILCPQVYYSIGILRHILDTTKSSSNLCGFFDPGKTPIGGLPRPRQQEQVLQTTGQDWGSISPTTSSPKEDQTGNTCSNLSLTPERGNSQRSANCTPESSVSYIRTNVEVNYTTGPLFV